MDFKVLLMLETPDWDHPTAVIMTSQLAMEFCICTWCSLCHDCPQRSMCWRLGFQPVLLLRDDGKVTRWCQQSEFSHLEHTLEEAWVPQFLLYLVFMWLILSPCETSSSLPQYAACHRPQSNRANQPSMETSGTISKMGVSPDQADNLGPFVTVAQHQHCEQLQLSLGASSPTWACQAPSCLLVFLMNTKLRTLKRNLQENKINLTIERWLNHENSNLINRRICPWNQNLMLLLLVGGDVGSEWLE